MVFQRHVTRVEMLNRAARAEADVAMAREVDAAKSAAAILITQTAQYIAEQVREAIQDEVVRARCRCEECASLAQTSRCFTRPLLWSVRGFR
jgi:hypothetical protein